MGERMMPGGSSLRMKDAPTAFDLRDEAQKIIDAIEPRRGAHMTLMCALHDAWMAGVEGRMPLWRFHDDEKGDGK